MSNTQTAAHGRKEWMPNRMFDPVSNPFAIQNLLEKKVETFVAQPDERSEAVFAFDSVMMANPVHEFSEQTIADPAADEAHEFQADWMDAGNEFTGEASAPAGDFVAGQAQAAAGFSADGDASSQEDAPVNAVAAAADTATSIAGQGDAAAAAVAAMADAGTEAMAAANAAEVQNDAGATDPGAMSTADASSTDASDATSEEALRAAMNEVATAEDTVAAAVSDAAMHAAGANEAVQVPVAVEAGSAAAAVAEEATPAPVAQPGISEEELQARLEAAREEGRAEVRESVRAEAHQQGHDEGRAAGYAQAKEELGKEYEDKIAQLQSMIDAMQTLSYNPDAMFEPMKTLSVHIAEQLVRGELSQSPQAISRLVDNCLRELNASGEKAVVIHLHPEDLEQYKPQAAQFGDALVLRADPKLERGSVRASLDGSVVEDLIQRRVAGLKKGLMQAPAPSWRANAGRLSDRIAEGQRGSQQVEDVTIAARKDAEARPEAKAATVAESVAESVSEAAVSSNSAATSTADSAADNANA